MLRAEAKMWPGIRGCVEKVEADMRGTYLLCILKINNRHRNLSAPMIVSAVWQLRDDRRGMAAAARAYVAVGWQRCLSLQGERKAAFQSGSASCGGGSLLMWPLEREIK